MMLYVGKHQQNTAIKLEELINRRNPIELFIDTSVQRTIQNPVQF